MEDFDKGGRPPKPKSEKSIKYSSSMPPDLYARLQRYCKAEERDMSFAIRKALDPWLKKQGF